MQRTVIVGLSGGVDSSVSALLLKEKGYRVRGLFMKNWEEDDTLNYCSAADDLADVKAVCRTLDIPLDTVNFAAEYWQHVFSLFLDEYRAGRTPNPDILCNKEIKFKAFLAQAIKLGADFIATGHYAQIQSMGKDAPLQLLKGVDSNKDQSYFLYTLEQTALKQACFPIGHLEKSAVRDLAKKAGLKTHNKKDSTGICFIGKRKFKDFLSDFLPNTPGEIKTPDNETLGEHQGLMFYTLGQRQGLNIGGQKGKLAKHWYVVGKTVSKNTLWVSQDDSHPWQFSSRLTAKDCHWLAPLPQTFQAQAKVRYRQLAQPCTVHIQGKQAQVTFTQPQRAVTPGQSVVLYQDNRCLGGGVICQTDSPGGLNAL